MRTLSSTLFVLSLFTLVGCGDGMGEVNGTVTFEGTPIEEGAISFYPTDGKTPTTGGAIKGGQYSVKVPPGTMKVVISLPKITGKKKIYNTTNSPEMPITVEALPAKYNEKSELTLEVVAGANRKDWELKR